MKNLIPFLILIATVLACKNESASNEKKSAVAAPASSIFDDYYNEYVKLFPFQATNNGINDYNDQFPIDISESYRDSVGRFFKKYKEALAKMNFDSLNANDKMNYEILNWEVNIALEGLKFPDHLMPINQFQSMTLNLGQLGSGDGPQPFKTVKDYDNWLKRISHLTEWADTAIANMKKGMAQGYIIPKSLAVKVLPQLKPIAETPTTEHLFYGPVKKLADNKEIDEANKARLTTEYSTMIEQVVKPSYKKLYDFIQKEYLPKTRASSGISAIPNGDKYYAYLTKYYTTSDLTPDQIFELGQKEVARIKTEMEKVKEQVGFKGDLKAFFKYVTEGYAPLRPFTQPKQVIANFNAIHDKMKPQLKKLFDITPKTPFEVRRTEAFREASASAEYVQGSLENGRAGVFYVPIPDIKKYNIFQDEALFLHEAIPGHHYQIALQQENKKLPEFRRNLWYGAYGEGWALYTEGLGKDLGLYTDPYQYFGRLGNEMHRAIRLVVDVGLHAKGWTREQAIKYDLDNEADSEEGITAEVERYMAIPGQALSYKVGEQRILALKKLAMDKMGANFNIQKFHNEVLNDGCVPLSILEKKVNNFTSGR